MKVQTAFGRVVKELRLKGKMTQADLAGRSELDPLTISFYELGKREPSLSSVLKIAKALKIKPEYILTRVQMYLSKGD